MVYSNFRNKDGEFFGDNTYTSTALEHDDKNPGQFWIIVENIVGKAWCELFIKLCFGYCGQEAAERLNKQVKQIRTISRNRQSHALTSRLLELKHYYQIR